MGTALIDWTARGMATCCALRWIFVVSRRRGAVTISDAAWWFAGWVLLVVHVACAFNFQHDWSHAAAYEHTARRTAEAVGWNWGGGLYFNYATILVWGADVVVLVRSRQLKSRAPELWTWCATAWIGFMLANATLVFGPGWWWGAAAILVATVLVVARVSSRSEIARDPKP